MCIKRAAVSCVRMVFWKSPEHIQTFTMSPWIKSLSLAASVFSCLPDTVYAVPSPHYVIKSVSNLERRQSNATTDAIENIIDALKAADFDDDWRSATCENKGVVDHTMYGPDRWEEVDAGGAWEAVLEGWKLNLTEGRVEKNFANNVWLYPSKNRSRY